MRNFRDRTVRRGQELPRRGSGPKSLSRFEGFGGARSQTRMRAILMTSMAMIAGMIPMALGLGEGGQQTAPLGRAVIGGLLFATAATLLVVPLVFSRVLMLV